MAYDILVISAHPDDAEVQMGGTRAALADQGLRALLVDLCDGEPSDFAAPGVRAEQARRAAAHLGVDRLFLGAQDRFICPPRLLVSPAVDRVAPADARSADREVARQARSALHDVARCAVLTYLQ